MPTIHSDRCDGCGKCLSSCAQKLFGVDDPELAALKIKKEGGQIQVIGCWECGECAKVCPEHAIRKSLRGVYVIHAKNCTGCGKCIDACPNGLIHMPEGHKTPEKCKKCAKCVMLCPNKVFTH